MLLKTALRSVGVLLLMLATWPAAWSQSAPQFDAIVVRQHDPHDVSQDGGIHWGGLAFEANNVPLTFLMTQAFGVKKWLIDGLPAWAAKSTWDVNAKVAASDLKLMQSLTREQRSQMLQTVLTEQFRLRYHFGEKLQPVYELSVLPAGPKFKASANIDGTKRGFGGWTFAAGLAQCERITMAQFANGLSPLVERVVMDKTGLTGAYDIEVRWTPENSANAGNDNGLDATAAPGIVTALREQAGLRLTSAKAMVPLLVIDAMEQPEQQ
ncbi:TIGR03435 family protein [Terriglobus roseus]|uniref:Soil-associated protein, TIGR03435 family n=1 Tax=Terriglobus roseus TaxID=392734 RepID=A0A1G7PPL1_9BACT|nr:TIGR03435 family protein [Terriglobus roseus]SDF88213.1 soil-associated protein, TIGR03435 family [Terriglobus roseus]